MQLDAKGRCCGRKPIVYKLEGLRFCFRCDRTYHLTDNAQIPNWAWAQHADGTWYYKCQRCSGKGWVEVGDPEVGHIEEDCPKCHRTGIQPETV